MTIEVLRLLSTFENVNDRESETAFFRTHVPQAGSLAYLNIIFKPAATDVLGRVAVQLRMPAVLSEFLKVQNGAILFSGALSIYGVQRSGQLLNRGNPFFDLPFNIEEENRNWPPPDSHRFLAIGGYSFDGSIVCIDRSDCSLSRFGRGERGLLKAPLFKWPSLQGWLTTEIARLSVLFDRRGTRLVDESQTVPHVVH
jgi:hypothetical protein